jgi:hypothetical protein
MEKKIKSIEQEWKRRLKALSKSGKQDEKHYTRMVQKIKSIDQEW